MNRRWPPRHRYREPEFRVELVCGHVVKVAAPPMGLGVRYGCTSGLGCGYRLAWVTWWRHDRPEEKDINRADRKEKGERQTDVDGTA